MKLEMIALAAAITLGSWPASAEYVRSTGDFDLACKSGAKSDLMQLSGPDDVFIKHHDSGPAAVTVCVPDDSPGNAFVQWGGDHTWRNSGNLRNGCIEVPNARSVKIRAVATSFQQNATYYTCTP